MGNVVYIQEEKEITVTNDGTKAFFVDRVEGENANKREISLADHAEASYLLISEKFMDGRDIYRRHFRLGEGAKLSVSYLFLGEGRQAWHLEHDLGARARIESRSLAIGKESQILSVRADYDFRGEGSFGRVKADAMISGASHLRYDANINVLPLAQKSDTRVDLHLRLSGPKARGEMTPGLNIAANDVKAGHSASTFQLSAEDLFYLRSRGLSPEEIARLFAMSMADIFVRDIPDERVKEEIIKMIKGKI